MDILITGANGFLGYYLVRQLLEKTHHIIATGKGECRIPFQDENFTYHPLDFTDDAATGRLFEEHKPSVVVHCGAMSKPDDCEQNREQAFMTNVAGTVNLLRHSAQLHSFFVFLSTDFVFDGARGMYTEDDQPAPVNYYGETKLLAEEEVKKYGGPWAIVRTVLVYGKTFSGRDNIATQVAKSLAEKKELKIFNDQVRTPTYVEDLAAGIVSIIEKKATGIYHISGEEVLTPYQIAVGVANYFGLNASLVTPVTAETFIPFPEAAKRPSKTGFDITKAKNELNYRPLSFQEGLRRTFETNY